jgi:hypothetical protein
MDKGLLVKILLGVGIPTIASAISLFALRVFPKDKAAGSGRSLGRKIGIWVDTIGNSKIGKKAMDTLEEGPMSTACRWAISVIEGILEVVDHDEVKLSVEKKINSDITAAYNEAMNK